MKLLSTEKRLRSGFRTLWLIEMKVLSTEKYLSPLLSSIVGVGTPLCDRLVNRPCTELHVFEFV